MDHAYPPFAPGPIVSVYERAGFDVNRGGARRLGSPLSNRTNLDGLSFKSMPVYHSNTSQPVLSSQSAKNVHISGKNSIRSNGSAPNILMSTSPAPSAATGARSGSNIKKLSPLKIDTFAGSSSSLPPPEIPPLSPSRQLCGMLAFNGSTHSLPARTLSQTSSSSDLAPGFKGLREGVAMPFRKIAPLSIRSSTSSNSHNSAGLSPSASASSLSLPRVAPLAVVRGQPRRPSSSASLRSQSKLSSVSEHTDSPHASLADSESWQWPESSNPLIRNQVPYRVSPGFSVYSNDTSLSSHDASDSSTTQYSTDADGLFYPSGDSFTGKDTHQLSRMSKTGALAPASLPKHFTYTSSVYEFDSPRPDLGKMLSPVAGLRLPQSPPINGSSFDNSREAPKPAFAGGKHPHAHALKMSELPQTPTSPTLNGFSGRKICRGCGCKIEGKSVRAREDTLSGRWHRSCFKCTSCTEALADEVYVIADKPYCQQCFHHINKSTCIACGKGIEGDCYETSGVSPDDGQILRYHQSCLRCELCHRELHDKYFEKDGITLCVDHVLRSQAASKELHHRMTKYLMAP